MTKADKDQDGSNGGPLAFAWETLPELAKNRWEEAVAFNVTIENQLTKAKTDRSHAEIERQRIAREILEATKEVCEEIAVDTKRALDNARRMEAEASRNHATSQVQLEEAKALKIEGEGHLEKIMAEAEQKCEELKVRASQEVQRMLSQADVMRASVQEELETQRIYSETARLQSESQEVLALIRVNRGEPPAAQVEVVEEQIAVPQATQLQEEESYVEPSPNGETSGEELQQSAEAADSHNGKKSARKPSRVK